MRGGENLRKDSVMRWTIVTIPLTFNGGDEMDVASENVARQGALAQRIAAFLLVSTAFLRSAVAAHRTGISIAAHPSRAFNTRETTEEARPQTTHKHSEHPSVSSEVILLCFSSYFIAPESVNSGKL